jgi:hypothetical protein
MRLFFARLADSEEAVGSADTTRASWRIAGQNHAANMDLRVVTSGFGVDFIALL